MATDKTEPRVRQDTAALEENNTDDRSITQRASRSRGKLPAFGKKWLAERLAGNAPTGALLITRWWPQSDQRWSVVVPGDTDPAEYDLSLAARLGVIVDVGSAHVGNAILMGKIEAAKPAVAVVIVDGEFDSWITE